MAGKYKVLQMSKGDLTKERQEAKLHAELMAKDGIPKLQVTPPNHLQGAAKQEYKRIVTSIGKLPLRNLDRVELENYCTWYGIYKDISIRIQKYANSIPEFEKEYERTQRRLEAARKDSDKETLEKLKQELKIVAISLQTLEGKRDDEIKHLDKATKNIKGLASDLGLNVNARMQMNMPKTEAQKNDSIIDTFG
ncbi:P27 family phage terminase small subunit [Lacticaseibacillus paracasei]|uniref:P27 family phage terminase small subunit n=1 Tax=Lacticaseibacillus paracasei TaxID=1597 RepID=UPI000F0BD1B0|nr:P27 family phage terminase small subunit [Lacticaseibacillus paracasei]RNE05589.1 putative phage terminase, small subunit, P27 family [Lacticaseibacillus paracasei]